MEAIRVIAVVVGLCAVASAQPAPPPAEDPPAEPPPADAPPTEPPPAEPSRAEAPPAEPSPAGTPDALPAEPAPVETTTPAQRAFEEGRELLEENRPAEACASFEASIKLDPDAPGTLLNLGLCHELLGHVATALEWFRKAQFRAAESHKDAYEQAAKEKTAVLAGKVPTIRVELANPPPKGATFYLDGNQVSEVEIVKLEVDPGEHTIEMRVADRPTYHEDMLVLVGDVRRIWIPIEPPPKRYVVVDRGATSRHVAYISAGAGVALVLGSAALSVVAKNRYDALEHPEDRQTWKNVARFGGTSMFLAGTAAIAGAAYLYFRAPSAERIEQTAVAPVVGPSQLGVAVHGSF